ncbi:hypothetical protein [Alteriqipengyuania lutimaris]|uniref:Bacteriocin n=1 Tax=Alteriqipengyuania lutimaris TaxID=1538146 RepID=A0A395LH15_9SPHN|nr:hypothetical protein [Alteriqipengyuania lutimaris]MBB3034986.1 small-conductance mechanosensitive channel [Alteriqipengyuania lutimaris]RDS76198.1 hypothetical protein DL238_00235 [Alteriqipengyuania lutimaris]
MTYLNHTTSNQGTSIAALSNDEILAISGGGDGEDLATIATGLFTMAAGAAALGVTAPAAPVLAAAGATAAMLAFAAEAFEVD